MGTATTVRRHFASPASLATSKVDEIKGVVAGVAVITVGPALGHGVLVDATTLEQVKACAEQFAGGLKVKMDHYSAVSEIVGYLHGFRIDGDVLRADLYLLESAPARAYVLEIAQKIPDTFGLSIAFSGIDERIAGTRPEEDIVLARCSEIYSADLVDDPAANPSGLFSTPDPRQPAKRCAEPAPTPTPKEPASMNEELMAALSGMIDEKMAPFAARLQALEAPPAPPAEDPEDESAPAAMSRADDDLRTFAADVVKETLKLLGTPPPVAPASPPPPPAAPEKAFEVLVIEEKAAGKSHNDAVRHVMSAHPAKHQAYLARVQAGERITF